MNEKMKISAHAAAEISKAVSGIDALLKRLHPTVEDYGALYGIMANLATIRVALAETPRDTSN